MIKTLIVDDSAIVRAMLKQVMESDGNFEVVGSAVNGENAIEQKRALSPDLIVMDINMPVMDGIEATKIIMQDSGKVPVVVAFTTEDEAKVGYKCLEAGAVEIIKKPNLASMTVADLKQFCERLKQISKSNPTKIKINRHAHKSNAIKIQPSCCRGFNRRSHCSADFTSGFGQEFPHSGIDHAAHRPDV